MALKRLEAHHMIAIQYLALPKRGGKTMEEIGTEAGVSRQAIYDWLKDPLFERELKRQISRNTVVKIPEVVDAMVQASVEDRNATAAKLILTMGEMLTEKVDVVKTDVSGMDREELTRRIQEYQSRKEA
ncbi:phBC6A51 family helix-turn-helix protein [Paenibacillus shunpengii]|uniref:PhBC6A51 family helix-turn-helix protein n=1 Tax=Paenibacillus shunpengii TaxID=2054424 RepID=A0ABW5SSH9_9BACL